MFDVIFNNIFVLIPLAIFIAFRIFEARRRQQNSSSSEKEKVKQPPLYPDEEADDEYDSSIPHWEADKRDRFSGPSSAGVSPSGVPLAGRYPAEVYPANPRQSSESRSNRPALLKASAPVERPVSRSFPSNLERLPTIKKAFLFSEILGPPKSLRD